MLCSAPARAGLATSPPLSCDAAMKVPLILGVGASLEYGAATACELVEITPYAIVVVRAGGHDLLRAAKEGGEERATVANLALDELCRRLALLPEIDVAAAEELVRPRDHQ